MEQTSRITRQIGSLLELGTAAGLTDGQLLERFLTRDGDAAERAFAALVERHGPMVHRVCRGILADPHDADDAFQATFLVLVRRARSLWVEDSLGPWLHQVALRTSAHARAAARRRGQHEASAARREQDHSAPEPDDLSPILHEEIGRLPERFRVPVILCDLQECSHDQAARHLGWPVGTVKSRLSRARQRLRERLLRRGLAPAVVLARPGGTGSLHAVLPAELVASTCRAATGFTSSRIITGGAAALAQGVLGAMSMTRWWKVACLLVVAGATVGGGGLLAGRGIQADEPGRQAAASPKPDAEMPVAAASRGPFRVVINDPGTLEPTRSAEVVSQLDQPSLLRSVVALGTRVHKGDPVAELDSAAIRDQLTNQKIRTQSAEASYQNARLTREVAEIAAREYEEGTFAAERAVIRDEIQVADFAIRKAGERADRLRRSQERMKRVIDQQAKATPADILAESDLLDRLNAAELANVREQLALARLKAKLHQLEHYTRPRTVAQLKGEIEKARQNELIKRQAWELEKDKEAKLEAQVANCKLVAPLDGVVDHVMSGPGELVGKGHGVVRIVDLGAPMQINVHIGEPMVDRLKEGQKAQVRVDAFPDEEFTGTVLSIAPMPDGRYWSNQRRKIYPTLVRLENGSKLLRPGMNGKAEITVSEHADAITVPFDAILVYQDKPHVAVKRPGGGFDWREVTLGEGDPQSKRVQVKEGLKPGEEVALKPADLLSDFDRRQKGIGEPTKPARRKPAPTAPAKK